jgi:hypothetical protein
MDMMSSYYDQPYYYPRRKPKKKKKKPTTEAPKYDCNCDEEDVHEDCDCPYSYEDKPKPKPKPSRRPSYKKPKTTTKKPKASPCSKRYGGNCPKSKAKPTDPPAEEEAWPEDDADEGKYEGQMMPQYIPIYVPYPHYSSSVAPETTPWTTTTTTTTPPPPPPTTTTTQAPPTTTYQPTTITTSTPCPYYHYQPSPPPTTEKPTMPPPPPSTTIAPPGPPPCSFQCPYAPVSLYNPQPVYHQYSQPASSQPASKPVDMSTSGSSHMMGILPPFSNQYQQHPFQVIYKAPPQQEPSYFHSPEFRYRRAPNIQSNSPPKYFLSPQDTNLRTINSNDPFIANLLNNYTASSLQESNNRRSNRESLSNLRNHGSSNSMKTQKPAQKTLEVSVSSSTSESQK